MESKHDNYDQGQVPSNFFPLRFNKNPSRHGRSIAMLSVTWTIGFGWTQRTQPHLVQYNSNNSKLGVFQTSWTRNPRKMFFSRVFRFCSKILEAFLLAIWEVLIIWRLPNFFQMFFRFFWFDPSSQHATFVLRAGDLRIHVSIHLKKSTILFIHQNVQLSGFFFKTDFFLRPQNQSKCTTPQIRWLDIPSSSIHPGMPIPGLVCLYLYNYQPHENWWNWRMSTLAFCKKRGGRQKRRRGNWRNNLGGLVDLNWKIGRRKICDPNFHDVTLPLFEYLPYRCRN